MSSIGLPSNRGRAFMDSELSKVVKIDMGKYLIPELVSCVKK